MGNIVVTGSRHWTAWRELEEIVLAYQGHTFHQGGAGGADRMVKRACEQNGIECIEHPADWQRFGKSAGFKRNTQMLKDAKPDLVIAFRASGKSNGTDHTIETARRMGIPVRIIRG